MIDQHLDETAAAPAETAALSRNPLDHVAKAHSITPAFRKFDPSCSPSH